MAGIEKRNRRSRPSPGSVEDRDSRSGHLPSYPGFFRAKNALEEHALFDALAAIRRLKARDAQSRLAPALEKRTAPKARNA